MFVYLVYSRNFENAISLVGAEMMAKMHRDGEIETATLGIRDWVLPMNINVLKQLNRRRARGFFATRYLLILNLQFASCRWSKPSLWYYILSKDHIAITIKKKERSPSHSMKSIMILCRFFIIWSLYLFLLCYTLKISDRFSVSTRNATVLDKSLFILTKTMLIKILLENISYYYHTFTVFTYTDFINCTIYSYYISIDSF